MVPLKTGVECGVVAGSGIEHEFCSRKADDRLFVL
jgi:hypothetical protein